VIPESAARRIGGRPGDGSKALKDFRAGARANDPDGMMRGIAQRMTADNIAAVA
jgi:cytochrome c553